MSDKNQLNHINPYFTNLNFSENYFYDGYGIRNIKSFIKSVKKIEFDNLKKLNSSFYDSIYSTKVIEAVNQSLNKNSKVILIK